jgi:hypothetical protein
VINPPSPKINRAVGFEVVQENDSKEEYWASGSFGDECLILVRSTPTHPQFSAREIVETMEFAYKMLRVKHFYYEAPHLLVEQLFILKNRRLKKLGKTHTGLSAELTIVDVTTNFWWVASETQLTLHIYGREKLDSRLLKSSGPPVIVQGKVDETDALCLLSPEVSNYITAKYLTMEKDMLLKKGGTRLLVDKALARKKISSLSAAIVTISHG